MRPCPLLPIQAVCKSQPCTGWELLNSSAMAGYVGGMVLLDRSDIVAARHNLAREFALGMQCIGHHDFPAHIHRQHLPFLSPDRALLIIARQLLKLFFVDDCLNHPPVGTVVRHVRVIQPQQAQHLFSACFHPIGNGAGRIRTPHFCPKK